MRSNGWGRELNACGEGVGGGGGTIVNTPSRAFVRSPYDSQQAASWGTLWCLSNAMHVAAGHQHPP